MVGPSTDAAGIQHGFRVDRRGCLVRVDYPGPPRSKNEAVGINDRGQIVGVYGRYGDGTTGETHTYVRDRRGFTSYDVPGALATGASKNNDRTADAHGFLFDDGELTLIDARRRPDVPVRHQRPRTDTRLRGERRQPAAVLLELLCSSPSASTGHRRLITVPATTLEDLQRSMRLCPPPNDPTVAMP